MVKNTLSDWRDGLLYLAMNTGARRQISRNAWDDLRENRLIVSAKTPTLSESILQLLA